MSSFEKLLTHWLAFEFGKGIGISEVQKQFNRRLDTIKEFNVTLPQFYFRKNQKMQIVYREGLLAYLYGLPNASVPMLMKTLEIGLKNKYKEIERKDKKLTLENLIDWGEIHYKKDKQLVHTFRHLRNVLHEDELLKDDNGFDTIRFISSVLNSLYPFYTIEIGITCHNQQCTATRLYEFTSNMCFIGNKIQLACLNCGKTFEYAMFP